MERPLLPVIGHHVAGRLFIVLWGGMAAAPVPALVLGLIGACAIGLPPLQALAVAGVGWMVMDGFVAHSYGDLAFGGSDLALATAVLLVVGLAAALSGPAVRR